MSIYQTQIEDYIKREKTVNLDAEGIDYKYFKYDDVYSIIIETPMEVGGKSVFYAYNIGKNRNEITNSDLLKKANLSESEFKTKLSNTIKGLEIYSNEVEKETKTLTLNEYSNKNLNDFELFINNDGNIYAILKLYITVGSGEIITVIGLETGDRLNIYSYDMIA